MKPPTSTKQKPGGRGKKQGREFVREDVELRHGGGTADRRRHAHTAPCAGTRRRCCRSPSDGTEPAPQGAPAPAARPGAAPRRPRSPFRQGPLAARRRGGHRSPLRRCAAPTWPPLPSRPPASGTTDTSSRPGHRPGPFPGGSGKDRAPEERKRFDGQDRAPANAPAPLQTPRQPLPHARGRRAFIKGPAARGAPPIGC